MKENENQIVVYQSNEVMRLEVRLENETVWLNQSKLGELFGVDRTVVNRHIRNIYLSEELVEAATCAKIAQVQIEGGRRINRTITPPPQGVFYEGRMWDDCSFVEKLIATAKASILLIDSWVDARHAGEEAQGVAVEDVQDKCVQCHG